MPYKDPPKQYQFKKGEVHNPAGRPKGKTMKEFAREFLLSMNDEDKIDFMNSLDPDTVWRMAEGNPHQTSDLEVEFKPLPLLHVLHNGSNKENSQLKEEN